MNRLYRRQLMMVAGIGLYSLALAHLASAVEGTPQFYGELTKIEGDRYTLHGDQGKDITVRVTKDTNMICAGGTGSQMSTGQESGKEHQEIPPTPHMEKQAKEGKGGGVVMPSESQRSPVPSPKIRANSKMWSAQRIPKRTRMWQKAQDLRSGAKGIATSRWAIMSKSRRPILRLPRRFSK